MGLLEYASSINWEHESFPEYGDFVALPFFALLFFCVRFFLDRFVFQVACFINPIELFLFYFILFLQFDYFVSQSFSQIFFFFSLYCYRHFWLILCFRRILRQVITLLFLFLYWFLLLSNFCNSVMDGCFSWSMKFVNFFFLFIKHDLWLICHLWLILRTEQWVTAVIIINLILGIYSYVWLILFSNKNILFRKYGVWRGR